MFWKKKVAAPKVEPVVPDRKLRINPTLLAHASVRSAEAEFAQYDPPQGVVPEDQKATAMAMDSTPYDYLNSFGMGMGYQAFPGYPRLAQMALLPEYRKMVAIIAEEMTRKWISLRSVGDDDKTDRLEQLEAELKRLNVREVFRQAAENDGYFGRGQIYLDMKTPQGALAMDDPVELASPLFIDKNKISEGTLVSLRSIEPVWTYPNTYNADNPLSPQFYRPQAWFVMAKKVDASRLLTLISRPVPDMLKASYNFGGLSLIQVAEPYVNNWLRTRDSVGDMIHMFSTSGLLTDMAAELAGDGGTGLIDRLGLFSQLRDNRGVLALNKDTEEFFQFNTPLSGLDALQAQAQEQMASISSIPLVKLLGVTPSGLNASSDGEIRVFYDGIHAAQENLFRPPLKKILDIAQLSLFGDIDPDIDFKFEPLYQLSELDQATVHKTEADTDAVLIGAGVISTDEARERVAADPDSPYQSLDLNAEIENDQDEDDDPTDDPSSGKT